MTDQTKTITVVKYADNKCHSQTSIYIGRRDRNRNLEQSSLADSYAIVKSAGSDINAAMDLYGQWLDRQLLNSKSPASQDIRAIAKLARLNDVALVCTCNEDRCHGEIIKARLERVISQGA
jgi:Domain of unknown function (DUF4326)